MAKENFIDVMKQIFKHEGGYVDHPKDPGGATNMGITFGTLKAWRKKPITKRDVQRLTKSEAMDIYRANYWDKLKCDNRPGGVDLVAMDSGVNSGIGRARKWVPMNAPGSPEEQIDRALNTRLAWLKTLSLWKTFGKGWNRRISGVRAEAKRLARSSDPNVVVGNTRSYSKQTEQAQARLEELGYHPGTVDGLFGSKTRDAILKFEEAHGMNGDGVLNHEEFATLKLDSALPAEKPNRKADKGELRKRSRIAYKSWLAQLLTWLKGFLGIGTVGAISLGDLTPAIDQGKEVVNSTKGLFSTGSPIVWLIGGVIIILIIFEVMDFFLKKGIEDNRMEMHLDGETD